MNLLFPFSILSLGLVSILIYGAGLIFSLVMLIDCLKRDHSAFRNTFTRTGEFDKLIWAGLIVISFFILIPVGSIVYFFVVKR